jgi:hypothetical protein
MVVLNSPAKIALRRAIALTSEGLALDAFICRFYVEVVEPYVSSYCPVLVVLARFLSVSQQESIGLLTGLAP